MTSEITSIYHELSAKLYRVKHDFCRRHMCEPDIRFCIGRTTFYRMLEEDEMVRLLTHTVPLNPLPHPDDLQFSGFKGRVVDGLNGFVIQVLNEYHP